MENDSLDAEFDQSDDVSCKDEKPFEFGIRLEIDNFSKVPIDEKIFSPPCIVHNLAWRIMIRRTEQSGKSRLGYFLVCDPDSTKAKANWNCEASVRLYIINREDPIDHFTREIKHLFCAEENDWGFATYCYWDYICDPRNKYILNDSVKFDVCIAVDRPDCVDLSIDNFANLKKYSRKMLKAQKVEAKKDYAEVVKSSVKRLKSDLRIEMAMVKSNLRSEMETLKTDLVKSFTDQLKSAVDEIKLQNTIARAANSRIPRGTCRIRGPESNNAAVAPQMTTGNTVHWFGPSQERMPVTEDDEMNDQLIKLSIDEPKEDEATSSGDEDDVSDVDDDDDGEDHEEDIRTSFEKNRNVIENHPLTEAERTPINNSAELADSSSDDFEILSITEGDNLGLAIDLTTNASLGAALKNAVDDLKSETTKDIAKTDTVNAATPESEGRTLTDEMKKTVAEPSWLVNFAHFSRSIQLSKK